MARKQHFITDYEYEEALRKFHNGFDNFTDHIEYKESLADSFSFNPRVIEDHLIAGERYTLLDGNYIITSYARLFNFRHRRFLKPKFYNSDIYMYCGLKTYKSEPIFKEMNWKFDKVELLKRYLDRDWNRVVMENCQYAYLAE